MIFEVLNLLESDVPDADAAVRTDRNDLLLLLVDVHRENLSIRMGLDRFDDALRVRVDDHYLSFDATSRKDRQLL